MYGALATIPEDVLESAKLDGAGAWRTALLVKLPLIKKWIAYMVIGAFAAGSQLFVEPELVSQATGSVVNQTWSPNQLAFYLSFRLDNFNYAAAISIDLLVARPDLRRRHPVAHRAVRGGPLMPRWPDSARLRVSPGQAAAYVAVALVAAFFAVPIVWLLLEAIGGDRPRALAVQLGVLLDGGSRDRRRTLRSSRLRHCDARVPRPTATADPHDARHADPDQRARAAALPRGELGSSADEPARGHPALRPVPVRRLPLLPLLQHRAVRRPAPDGAPRRLQRMAGLPRASPFRSRRRSPR